MEIKSDIECKGRVWYDLNQQYVHKFFDTFWGVFKTCISIGILYDRQLTDDGNADEEEKVTVPRTMFNRCSSEMQFFFQAAILASNCVELSEKDRLYLAFSEEISEDELEGDDLEIMRRGVSQKAIEFDKVKFLKQFANYGATKLHECLSSNDSETMENLMEFLNKSYRGEVEELKQMSEVDELWDE